jgi:hypothetical protein|tara:strand:+ start:2421 stop:2744 length:324 start_codon:yes stop_codon:yes gene_type:complete
MRCAIIAFFLTCASFAQTDIEVIQFSASFVKDKEISMKGFKYETKTLYMSQNPDMFTDHDVKYIPTLILLYNGEEYFRIESGISLTLPEDSKAQLEEKIDEIIASKF